MKNWNKFLLVALFSACLFGAVSCGPEGRSREDENTKKDEGIASSAEALSYSIDGTDPATYKGGICAKDAYTYHQAEIWDRYRGTYIGTVQLRYSPGCHTTWARLYSFRACGSRSDIYPSSAGCGDAHIHRNNDGKTYGCAIPKGETGCYTAQVNDANPLSSFADGGVRTLEGVYYYNKTLPW